MKGKLLLSGLMAEDKGTFVFGRESAMSWWNPTAGTPILEMGLTLAMSRPTHRTSSKSATAPHAATAPPAITAAGPAATSTLMEVPPTMVPVKRAAGMIIP